MASWRERQSSYRYFYWHLIPSGVAAVLIQFFLRNYLENHFLVGSIPGPLLLGLLISLVSNFMRKKINEFIIKIICAGILTGFTALFRVVILRLLRQSKAKYSSYCFQRTNSQDWNVLLATSIVHTPQTWIDWLKMRVRFTNA